MPIHCLRCQEGRDFEDGQRATGASLVAQLVKNLPAMQETPVWSLGWEDPLEKGMATHSSIFAWRRSLVGYSPWGHKKSDTTEQLSTMQTNELQLYATILINTIHIMSKRRQKQVIHTVWFHFCKFQKLAKLIFGGIEYLRLEEADGIEGLWGASGNVLI